MDKPALRRRLLHARSQRSAASEGSGPALLEIATRRLPELATARAVTAYVPLPGEPDVGPLVAALHERGVVVLLPVMRPGNELDWVVHDPAGGPTRGAVDDASVLLVPALAVDRSGHRLGRGGGYYDRCLSRLRPDQQRVAVVFDDEVVDGPLPVEQHDQPVHAALTPTRVVWFTPKRAD